MTDTYENNRSRNKFCVCSRMISFTRNAGSMPKLAPSWTDPTGLRKTKAPTPNIYQLPQCASCVPGATPAHTWFTTFWSPTTSFYYAARIHKQQPFGRHLHKKSSGRFPKSRSAFIIARMYFLTISHVQNDAVVFISVLFFYAPLTMFVSIALRPCFSHKPRFTVWFRKVSVILGVQVSRYRGIDCTCIFFSENIYTYTHK